MEGINMAATFEEAISDADTLLLLVKHKEFAALDPHEIARKTSAKVIVDTVNGWDNAVWKNNGFKFFRIGDNKSNS
jgi:UDP-N-acetyl-D-mannosaminuronate dehydrogenase